MAAFVVVPFAVLAVASGIFKVVIAAARHKTKKWLKKMGLRSAKTKVWRVKDLRRGDQICHRALSASIIKHHAIVRRVIDDNTVKIIHFAGPPTGNGPAPHKSKVMIHKHPENLRSLANNGEVYRVDYEHPDNCYSPDEVIARAKSMLRQRGVRSGGYDLFKNNCEHFATWCKTGEAFSKQAGTRIKLAKWYN